MSNDILACIGYLVIFALIVAVSVPITWSLFGGFDIFLYFINLARVKDPTPATAPVFFVCIITYWLFCKRFGMLGLVLPPILRALKGV